MSTTIRTPSLAVTLEGAPLSDVLSARVQAGFNLRVAEAQVTLRALPAGIMPWDEVMIAMGGTAGTAAVRFTGFFVSSKNQLYPKETTLVCKGHLGLAEVLEAQTNVDMATWPGDPGHEDEVMISTVLYICGLVPAVPAPAIGGTGQLLGHTSWDWGFEWAKGESGLAFIERLDEVCLGWRTYDTFDGTIKRTQITTIPAASASATFTEHVDIFRATEEMSIIEARNRVVVDGFPGRKEQVEISFTASGGNQFLRTVGGAQWYLTHKFSSPMIEFEKIADKPTGYGLSCEEVALWLLTEMNAYSEKVMLVTPRDDVIEPGDTIHLNAPTRLGVHRNLWVQEVNIEINRQGAFSQVLTCIARIPVNYAVVAPVVVEVTIPAVTATYASAVLAAVVAVGVTISHPTVMPSYDSNLTAAVVAVGLTVTLPAVTASSIVNPVAPIMVRVTPGAVTATWVYATSAVVAAVVVTVTIPAPTGVTAMGILEAQIFDYDAMSVQMALAALELQVFN